MKVIPSIAFGEFSGTAGDVTARTIGGRTILNHKAYQAKTKTPAQAASRNTLSKVSRAYKQLTDSQIKAWGTLAEHLKGISTFGMAAEMTAHNAFVRINENRQLVGRDMLEDAPEYRSDVPEVDYEDFWVTPTVIVFTGIERPQDSYRLVVKMSAGLSNGVSNGWNKTVIVAPGMEDDWGEANITKIYNSTIGFAPQIGDKVFIELYWLDADTGFVGETMRVKATVKADSQIEGDTYEPRNEILPDNIVLQSHPEDLKSYKLEQSDGNAVITAEADVAISGIVMGLDGELQGLPESYVNSRCYLPGRGKGRCPYGVSLVENYNYASRWGSTFQIACRAGKYDPTFEMFGTACTLNN